MKEKRGQGLIWREQRGQCKKLVPFSSGERDGGDFLWSPSLPYLHTVRTCVSPCTLRSFDKKIMAGRSHSGAPIKTSLVSSVLFEEGISFSGRNNESLDFVINFIGGPFLSHITECTLFLFYHIGFSSNFLLSQGAVTSAKPLSLKRRFFVPLKWKKREKTTSSFSFAVLTSWLLSFFSQRPSRTNPFAASHITWSENR